MNDWNGVKVLMIGAARQGLALARYLVNHSAQVTLNDHHSEEQMMAAIQAVHDLSLTWALGGHPISLLDGMDIVCISGGVPLSLPLIQEAQKRGIPLSNDSEIFMHAAPCPVVGITGSAGKTTTTTLVGRIAQSGVKPPRNVWVGGNIGHPLISSVNEMQANDLVIVEFSSFQLELITTAPQVAAILNITPNHLDRHGTMEAYIAAKARLIAFQKHGETAVLNRDDPGAWALASTVRDKLMTFGLDRPPSHLNGTYIEEGQVCLQHEGEQISLLPISSIMLRGVHNQYNVLAACAIAYAAGLPVDAMEDGIAGFAGVPHRLEHVRNRGGADWYNDSIATAPERSMAAIRSFDEPIVLLAGGKDKDLPWDGFAELIYQRVDHLILFGEAAELIQRAVGSSQPGHRPFTMTSCTSLYQAVQEAAEVSEPGDVVLLSPGGTSFDEFKDFEERGAWFRQWVKELT